VCTAILIGFLIIAKIFHTIYKSSCNKLKNDLEPLVFIDPLTEVANRRFLDHAFCKEIRRCQRSQKELALLMIDIDHFKLYNDFYGHQAGDECLKNVAKTLAKNIKNSHDLLARYGGEEFVCVLSEIDLATLKKRAEDLRRSIEALSIPHHRSPTASVVTVSIGATITMPNEYTNATKLISLADEALYIAKNSGRNKVAYKPLLEN
jgi:diguanylate cyclase (GGDEF)-like protein